MKRSGSCLPKFEQIKREIEDRIRKGFFRHGDTLPPENELAQLFNAGRNTIRRAVELLEKDSLIIKQQGRVSRINLPGETSDFRSVKANRLAYFTNYLPAMINHNMVYMDLFRLL